jgi:hypothetical protein
MEREIERFDVELSDGSRDTVVIFQDFIDATAMGDQGRQWVPGLKRAELISDGSPLNYVDPQTFKHVFTDEIIRKV